MDKYKIKMFLLHQVILTFFLKKITCHKINLAWKKCVIKYISLFLWQFSFMIRSCGMLVTMESHLWISFFFFQNIIISKGKNNKKSKE